MGFEPATLILAKVFEFVHGVLASPLSGSPVYGTSTESARIRPCCRAVYYDVGPFERWAARGTPWPNSQQALLTIIANVTLA
jgi:hypothetical protein